MTTILAQISNSQFSVHKPRAELIRSVPRPCSIGYAQVDRSTEYRTTILTNLRRASKFETQHWCGE
jgi:hypothetical protein